MSRAGLRFSLTALSAVWLCSCFSSPSGALKAAEPGPGPVVKFDVFHKPLPDIPLPNDFATRFDATSPTHRRVNASVEVAPTQWEKGTRSELNKLTGWGTLAPVTVSFSEALDVEPFFEHHRKDNLDYSDDVVLVLDVTPGSPGHCQAVPLDLGQGNYPGVLQRLDLYPADPRASLQTLQWEEVEEDVNANGVMDPGEDTDMDGVLDHPNTRDGKVGGERLEFYERETNTLIMKPLVPMRPATTYAAVLTKRLKSASGEPVRSPFAGINHTSQTKDLSSLAGCLPGYGLTLDEVAFTWSFTTQDIAFEYKKVRDGLYGLGSLKGLSQDFPATVSRLRDVRKREDGVVNTKIVPGELVRQLAVDLFVRYGGGNTDGAKPFEDGLRFIDFQAVGEVISPQFFPRNDANGKFLPLYQQVWNLEAPPRPEGVGFWAFIPKNRKGPSPVAIFVHGHGSNKFDGIAVAGLLASYGVATISIDGPSHGIDLSGVDLELAKAFFAPYGLQGLGEGIMAGRALDLNGDGKLESGADYWSSYVFHTRDMVRQTMVDLMQVMRMLRSFDGTTRWAHDVNRDGTPELAGDFDGDGQVDIGGDQPVHLIGGSLGGITTAVASGVEPMVGATVSLIPGGMLSEVGIRSSLGGVRNAMVLRMLAPLVFSTGDGVSMMVPDAQVDEATRKLHGLPALAAKDTVVLRNLKTHEYRCAVVQQDGKSFRVAVASDQEDLLELEIYKGPLPTRPREGCEIPEGATPYVSISTFEQEVKIGDRTYPAGSPLVSLSDGFGERRATPDLRRLLGLAQIAMESADPMNWAPYWDGARELEYGTGEKVRSRVLLMPSIGDTGVPVATGVGIARAAGFVEYDRNDPRYGKSQNQVLIDSWAIEGLQRTARYGQNSKGQSVLMDLEHTASVAGADDGFDVPRLSPPLRLIKRSDRLEGGYSGMYIPMLKPEGLHGLVLPNPKAAFDLGTFLFNVMGRYIGTGGQEFSWDPCQASSTCSWIAPVPAP